MADSTQVARLDRSKPPEGYTASGQQWSAPGESVRFAPNDGGLAAAWGHKQKREDPPGMKVWQEPLQRNLWWFNLAGAPPPSWERSRVTEAEARRAAWAWYWRRKDLADWFEANIAEALDGRPVWPSFLELSDATVASYMPLGPRGAVRRRSVADIVHRCDFAQQPDIRIACSQEWTVPAWGAEATPGGPYLADNGQRYTFNDDDVTCPACLGELPEVLRG